MQRDQMDSAEASNASRDLRIVLLGKTGSGKSATGNTILENTVFKAENSPSSVTKTCQRRLLHCDDRSISVIDTPGLCDSSTDEATLKKEVENCIRLSVPGPHVFLLVLRVGVRFTAEEQRVFRWIKENFGADAGQYTLAVFTYGDTLESSIETYISKSPDLKKVIDDCKAGYTVFDNSNMRNRTQVADLFEKIDLMVQRNGGPYSSAKYEEAQRKMKSDAWWGKVGDFVENRGIDLMKAAVVATAVTNPAVGVPVALEEIGLGSYLVAAGGVATAAGRWMKPKPGKDEEN